MKNLGLHAAVARGLTEKWFFESLLIFFVKYNVYQMRRVSHLLLLEDFKNINTSHRTA